MVPSVMGTHERGRRGPAALRILTLQYKVE